jgi:kumamolisin
LTMPRHLAGYVHRVGLHPDPRLFRKPLPASASRESARAMAEPPEGGGPKSDTAPPANFGGFTPADIRQIYEFPDEWDGTGETIALLRLGGSIDEADLHCFWRGHGIEPPQVFHRSVGPVEQSESNRLYDLEATMTVEWVGAMAPGARIVVYSIDPKVIDDPVCAFLAALLWDDDYAPSVASTSWVTPERKYYQHNGHRRVVELLNEAAALGVTVISASGDWGPFDGIPNMDFLQRYVSDAPWPHATFPPAEERVLGVGGTMITNRSPLTEIGWSGVLPPELEADLHFERIASSGGFSEEVPIPDWQRAMLPSYATRGAGSPAVIPYGRGFPDVALAAAGPSVLREGDEKLTSQGYQAVIYGQWVDYAGGTSLAAPIWAAIIARANQARRQAGRSPVGFVNPLLYRLRDQHPSPFRSITAGDGDVAMNVVDVQGNAVLFELHGYDVRLGWDAVTGLGVPRVTRLIELIRDTPLK